VIYIQGDMHDRATTEIVVRAFERSFTRGQVREVESCADVPRQSIVVVVNPDRETAGVLARTVRDGGKLILHGPLDRAAADIAGVQLIAVDPALRCSAESEAAPPAELRASRAALRYSDTGIGRMSPLRRRHFCRYDFSNEWNNLGYGRIGLCDDRWSISHIACRFETPVAMMEVDGQSSPGAAVTLRDLSRGAILWFARPVGAVDGQDWAIVDHFISAYREDDLPCRPRLMGMPHGYDAAVSMRLDCDEDVASARPLFDLYRTRHRPLSLAVATGRLQDGPDVELISDVSRNGGAILSHSVTHAPRWGGSGRAAEQEARDSKARLEGLVDGLEVRFAVSPFHQNPVFVPQALALAGYDGFISGSIANDPEYLMARGGIPPFGPPGVVLHTQSCMLHGDCMLAGGDPLRIYKDAFRLARASHEFFGYLDHPFSERYAYGWRDEGQRLAVHAAYLDFMEGECDREPILFVNEDTCMRFIKEKSAALIRYDERGKTYELSTAVAAGFRLSIGYGGNVVEAAA
jgi:hypothetical protein